MDQSQYQQQLEEKIQRLQQQFAIFQPPELDVFSSPIQHFRMRAEFRIWHTDDDLFYAMFQREQQQKRILRIDDFPIATTAITTLMPKLRHYLLQHPILSSRLFEVNFLATLKGEMLVSLIYHRQLDDEWQAQAKQLQQDLSIKVIGRSRGQKIVLSDDFVLEQFNIHQKNYIYKQIENGFSQPNAEICQKMLHWACDVAKQSNPNGGDLLELYCGNANFTLPLSAYFGKVLATELAKSSVQAAEWNIKQNQIDNIKIARLSAEEFSQAYQGVREFRRLAQSEICLQDYDFSTIFVDPPRAGIDDDTLALMSEFEHIIYVSCNPDTLYANLQKLPTHHIKRFALFDQFPYTHHMECAVWLTKHQ